MIITDHLGNEIEKNNFNRIISLVPSQTELLYDLGLGERVIGITKFCIHPENWFRKKTRIGGTKQVKIKKVEELKPDLIIGNKEENQKEDILALEKVAPIYMSDIYTLSDSVDMIKNLGLLLGVEEKATKLIEDIHKGFKKINKFQKSKTCLYLIWKNPYMGVAKNTFIDHIMTQHLGFKNFLSDESRYPKVDLENPSKVQEDFGGYPDYFFLSSEPFPFKEKHIDELKENYPNSKFVIVDGEYFSWYGSRLKFAPKYFEKLIEELKS